MVGRTPEVRERMKRLILEADGNTCSRRVFLGFTDSVKEGHWVDSQTGEEISKNMAQK